MCISLSLSIYIYIYTYIGAHLQKALSAYLTHLEDGGDPRVTVVMVIDISISVIGIVTTITTIIIIIIIITIVITIIIGGHGRDLPPACRRHV